MTGPDLLEPLLPIAVGAAVIRFRREVADMHARSRKTWFGKDEDPKGLERIYGAMGVLFVAFGLWRLVGW